MPLMPISVLNYPGYRNYAWENIARPGVGISARRIAPECDSTMNNDLRSGPP
jgi:hypothetical protein